MTYGKDTSETVFSDMKLDNDYNQNWYKHKAHVCQLLKQGAMGILGGMLYMLFVTGMSGFEDPSILLLGVFASIVLAGVPYGWSILNRTVGNWNASGSLFFVACFYVIKATIAFVIGTFIYPPVLVFNLIHSQKSKRRIFVTWIILAASILLLFVLLGQLVAWEAKTYPERYAAYSSETVAIQEVKVVTAESFTEFPAVLEDAIEQSLMGTQESELECTDTYDWSVPQPTQIHGVFYLEAKDSEYPHHDILENVYVSNAIAVVSGYFLEEGSGMAINAWEMDIWIYPNFYFDTNGTLSYDEDNAYCSAIRAEGMEYLMDWFQSEYSDMTFTELSVPVS